LSNEKVNINNEQVIPEYKPTMVRVLNVIAGILALVLILVIYIPNSIWREENTIRDLSRKRMLILNEVEKYYTQMAGKIQEDPILAMKIVSAARDSTRADSNFFGQQTIKLPEGRFTLNVPKNFYMVFDTNFALKYQKTDSLTDTTVKILKWNTELMTYDTVYVMASRLESEKTDPNFKGVLSTELSKRVATNTYYRRYYLKPELAMRPLLDTTYAVLKTDEGIRIQDPLNKVIREPRFLVFSFIDSTHGYIENDFISWK